MQSEGERQGRGLTEKELHFVVQGLHIFEPRYRQLMADALAGIGRGVAPDFPAVHTGGRTDAPGRVADARIGIRGRMPVLLLAGGKDGI